MELQFYEAIIKGFCDEPWMSSLQMYKDEKLSVFYSPFEYVNKNAKIVICGITPGRTQALLANQIAREKLIAGSSVLEAQIAAKNAASFSKLRNNLVAMLDNIGVNQLMHLDTCMQLFGSDANLVHYTSAIRYPVVMNNGDGYNGTPRADSHSYLRQLMDKCLADEARSLSNALWLPLGKGATESMEYLIVQGVLDEAHVIKGLPHPSGANAERIAYFLGKKPKEQLSSKTNGDSLDRVRSHLLKQIEKLRSFK